MRSQPVRRTALLLGVAAVLVGATSASAGPPLQPFSLTLYPARILVPAQGRSNVQTVNLVNSGRVPVHVTAEKDGFNQAPDGTIHFTRATGALSPASWVTITPSAFDLAPGQHLAVHVGIAVPSAPEPGEHQVGVVFLVPAGKSAQNVAINRGIGTQLLISVPGPIVDRIALAKLAGPGLVDGGPATFTVTVHNRGTIHHDFVRPGQLVARVHGQSVKFPDFTVLRGSTRVVSTQWQHPPLVCLCRVTLAADDGQGHQIVVSRQVIVFPLRFSAGLILLALGLALAQRRRRARRRPHR